MGHTVKAIPDGYHRVTASLVVNDAAKAIEFYARAFGAQELFRMPGPGGTIVHAELQIGDSRIMLADETPGMTGPSPKTLKGTTVGLFGYVPDVDAAAKRAVSAGATEKMPVTNMFWGDRYGVLVDPFGHEWHLATHVEDVSPEEMQNRMAAMG